MESASFLLYLLNLFEGKITLTEIMNLDYALLISMKEIREAEVKAENERIKKERAMINNKK